MEDTYGMYKTERAEQKSNENQLLEWKRDSFFEKPS